MKKLFLATNNQGKISRFKQLIESLELGIQLYTANDLGIEEMKPVENGASLAQNAEIKARSYFRKVPMPILANDTGFYVEGEGYIEAPKRIALGGVDESTLTKEEIADMLLEFWKNVAKKYGGMVDAAWLEAFAVIDPAGEMYSEESRREVILTDTVYGHAHIEMPVRALYISKDTNKPVVLHSKEEELLEMKPVTDALRKILESLKWQEFLS